MLHQVYAALVAARGFSNNKLTDANGKEGNIVFMRVMMDALAIQPCNPTCAFSFLPLSVFGPSFLFSFFILFCFIFLSFPHFVSVSALVLGDADADFSFHPVVQARDAIIQADQNRYNGANKCIIAKAFASRGLGLKASAKFVDDATLPTGC